MYLFVYMDWFDVVWGHHWFLGQIDPVGLRFAFHDRFIRPNGQSTDNSDTRLEGAAKGPPPSKVRRNRTSDHPIHFILRKR